MDIKNSIINLLGDEYTGEQKDALTSLLDYISSLEERIKVLESTINTTVKPKVVRKVYKENFKLKTNSLIEVFPPLENKEWPRRTLYPFDTDRHKW